GVVDVAVAVAAAGGGLADDRRHVDVAEQRLEAGIAAGLVGQQVVAGVAVAAQRAVLGAMDGDAEVVGVGGLTRRLVGGRVGQRQGGSDLHVLGRADAKKVRMSAGMLSISMLATENAPKSQPARVNGTHGAGSVLPVSVSISGLPSPAIAVQ